MAEHFHRDAVISIGVRLDAEHTEGVLFDPHQPQLRITDLGPARGDGLFETLLVSNGRVRQLDAHLERLERSAQLLQIGVPPQDSWRAGIQLGLDEFGTRGLEPEEIQIRLVATRGVADEPASQDPQWAGTYYMTLSPVDKAVISKRGRPVTATLLDRGYDSAVAARAPWLLLGAKTLSYAVNMAALRYAKEQGFDDVIFTSSDDLVLEGPISTVLMVNRGSNGEPHTLTTPTLSTGILPGTSQGAIFAAAGKAGWHVAYGPVTPDELKAADHVWLISSVRLVTPVSRIDDAELALDEELTAALSQFLSADLAEQYPREA